MSEQHHHGTADGARRRVVVTAAGIVTAHGCGWDVNAAAFREGAVSLRPVTVFDAARQRVQTAGEAMLPAAVPTGFLTRRETARLDRAACLLLLAGAEALQDAGPVLRTGPVPVVLGSSAGGMALGEAYHRQARTGSGRRGQATRVVAYQAQHQVALLCRAHGIEGRVSVIANACASGANAIGHAFTLVRSGRTRAAVCGGYDALCSLVFAGFDALKALSTTTARPFDAGRDGLALGEGAAVLLLEEREEALARGAPILAEIAGYGASTDLHHLTQPHPEGAAAVASMGAACRMAGIAPAEVDYLNAHGTGTPLNDGAEAAAIARWAGAAAAGIPVSSTKGGIGHLLGGAGAVEAVVCLMAMRHGFLPPGVPVTQPDPACTFDLVTAPRQAAVRTTLTNSFGFGGSNATLVFRKEDA